MTHMPATTDVVMDPLEQRLRTLRVTPPADFSGKVAAGLAGRRLARRRRIARRTVAVALAVCCLCTAAGAASYCDPSFAHALADTPGLGAISEPALAAAGLSAGDVTPLHDSGRSVRR